MFSLTLMSKGEKRCGLDATVGGLRRIVQPFRVAINAKGGYCWHVYRKSVLVIDGKNNNEPNLESRRRREISEEIVVSRSVDEVQEMELIGGEKVEIREHLENLLSQRDQKAQEEERQWHHWINGTIG
jgi:hypothetical protein